MLTMKTLVLSSQSGNWTEIIEKRKYRNMTRERKKNKNDEPSHKSNFLPGRGALLYCGTNWGNPNEVWWACRDEKKKTGVQ